MSSGSSPFNLPMSFGSPSGQVNPWQSPPSPRRNASADRQSLAGYSPLNPFSPSQGPTPQWSSSQSPNTMLFGDAQKRPLSGSLSSSPAASSGQAAGILQQMSGQQQKAQKFGSPFSPLSPFTPAGSPSASPTSISYGGLISPASPQQRSPFQFSPGGTAPNTPLATRFGTPFSPVPMSSPMWQSPGYQGVGEASQDSYLQQGYNPRLDLSAYGVDHRRKVFFANFERLAEDNNHFRAVIFTAPNQHQFVVMALQPDEDIGTETHQNATQFFRIESGTGTFVIGDERGVLESIQFQAGDSFEVPAGRTHNVIADTTVKLYTIYSERQHPYDAIDNTKEDARIREGN